MIPYDERQAWEVAKSWFGYFSKNQLFSSSSRWIGFASGRDSKETILIPAKERNDGIDDCPLLVSIEPWTCWLLKQASTVGFPTEALNLFHSLSADACRLLGLVELEQIIEGRVVSGKRGEYQHLLRWTIDKLSPDECRKQTWFDPPNDYIRPLWGAKGTPKRWFVEMPCVFSAIAQAIDRHLSGLSGSWPLI